MDVIKQYAIWAVIALVALAFAAAGAAKLAGVEMMHQSFTTLGLPGWFGYFIGACEVAGAVGLFIRPLSALAAAGHAIIMVGAIYFHVVHTPVAQALPALVLLVLCLYVFVRRRGSMLAFGS